MIHSSSVNQMQIKLDKNEIKLKKIKSSIRWAQSIAPKNNPHEGEEGPKFLPWVTSSHVLTKYSERSPPFHLTAEGVSMELDNYRITRTLVTKHRISRR